MTARGIDFLEDWIARNVTAADNAGGHQWAVALAQRCAKEAAAQGIALKETENGRISITGMILDAMIHVAEPGTPGD